ncbi:Chemotaxis protein CheW [Alphaproteobacteria bacterium SO-S41]|nr:Chemotaxis protein CheW [Alphaproteobacteria bacterium SO-S41]
MSAAVQTRPVEEASASAGMWLTVFVGTQTFGLPVLRVRDVIASPRINHVPLAPREVAGSLNLRGRIVTAIDMRTRLGLPPREGNAPVMCAIVDVGEGIAAEFYALLVDEVGDVLSLGAERFEKNPVTLAPDWQTLCTGLFRLDAGLMLALDIDTVVMAGA